MLQSKQADLCMLSKSNFTLWSGQYVSLFRKAETFWKGILISLLSQTAAVHCLLMLQLSLQLPACTPTRQLDVRDEAGGGRNCGLVVQHKTCWGILLEKPGFQNTGAIVKYQTGAKCLGWLNFHIISKRGWFGSYSTKKCICHRLGSVFYKYV